MPRFVMRVGGGLVPLAPGRVVIGRGDECDIIVEDDLASRRHAVLVVTEAAVEIEDANSRNGVLVDGQKIARRTALGHQAVVGIGNARLVLLDADQYRDARADQLTPSRPLARFPAPAGKPVSAARGTLVGVSLAALVFRARAAVQSGELTEMREAVEKLAANLGPGMSLERELVEDALTAVTGCAVALARAEPARTAWLDTVLSVHAKLERTPDDAALKSLADVVQAGPRASAAALSSFLTAIRERKPPPGAEEGVRLGRLQAILSG